MRRTLASALIAVALVAVAVAFCESASAAEPDSEQAKFFEEKVQPLLTGACYDCHSHASGEASGGLVLDSKAGWEVGGDSGPAIAPGKPDESLILKAVTYGDESLQMPPDGKLGDEDIAVLREWIASGAFDPRTDGRAADRRGIDIEAGKNFWAFRSPVRHETPTVPGEEAADAVDRFLFHRLQTAGMRPSPRAEPATLLRRLHYDLTGLPPGQEDLDRFLAESDRDFDAAWEAEADRLLASPGFGEKWGRRWLDLARYADSNGSSFNPPFRAAWRYRNWVIDATNRDLPYDRFLMKQIAGDLLPFDSQEERDENLVATGYLMLGSKVLGQFDKEQLELDVVDEQLDTIGKSLLGLTVACARCHDHKFDPVPQRDYYALAGIFTSVVTLQDRLGGPKEDESDWSRRGLGPGGDERLQEFLADRRYEWVKSTAKLHDAKRKVEEIQQRVATEEGDRREEIERELAQAMKDLEAAQARADELAALMPPYAMAPQEEREPEDEALRIRGVAGSRGEVVPRGFLQVAAYEGQPAVDPNSSGRLQLAEWIASEKHPLTARVYVNRIWQGLFRFGLVRSVDNFGTTGETPTHPELLDRLAIDFVEAGWRTKPLVRRLVLTKAYRMATNFDSHAAAIDPENRLLWRQNRRRLEAEEIRDSLLSIGGRLDHRPTEGMVDHLPIGDVSNLGEALRIEDDRRTVYQPIIRTLESDVLSVFDFANPSMSTGERPRTTVAPQALYLLNGDLATESAPRTAKLLMDDAPRADADELLDVAFRRIVQRTPTEAERSALRDWFSRQYEEAGPTEHDVTKLCHVLFASTQFQFLD